MATAVSNSVTLPAVDSTNGTLTDEYINGLVQGGSWQFGTDPRVLTYSFNINFTYEETANIIPGPGGNWTSPMTNAVNRGLTAWSNVANISFQNISSGSYTYESNADIALTLTGDELLTFFGAVGIGVIPDPVFADELRAATGLTTAEYPNPAGDIFLDNYYPGFQYLDDGGFGYDTILHEIGHALGLKHANDDGGNGRPTFPELNLWEYRTPEWTIMSGYNDYATLSSRNLATPMPLDILAIQHIYGANMTYRAGNDIYPILASSAVPFTTIWDAGGIDTVDASSFGAGSSLFIDLTPGYGRIVGNSSEELHPTHYTAIAFNVTLENAIGSNFSDTITGNTANNTLAGRGGHDSMDGGSGDDVVSGESGDDTILGGIGNDTLRGDAGNDSLHGGTGTDTASYANATGGVTANLSVAGAQNTVNMGSDTLIAMENLLGGNFNDTLTGNAGANRLDGGAGIDTLAGGAGDDLYLVNLSIDIVNENAAAGTDTVQSSTTHTLRVNVEHLILTGSGNAAGTGNGLDNTLTGNSGNNSLHGSTGVDTASYANATGGVTANLSVAGAQNTVNMGSDTLIAIENLLGGNFNDTLTGNAGANRLDGGAGIDTLAGGAGDDLYLVNLSTDIVNENAAAGTDTVQSSTTHTLRVNVEHLILTGSGNAAGTGNGLDNTLTGNSGNNSLHGSTGTDTASYANATGGVTVNLSVAGAQNTVNMGSDTLIAIENLLGGNFNDTLTGNAGANRLDGGAGIDTLAGGAGDDLYLVNLSIDIVNENAAAGTDTVQSSTTHTLRVNVEHLILTGSGNAAGTGNGLDNTLTGNSGNNSLHGSTGVDTASYANATGGVTANLSVAGAQNTVNMGSDTLIAIENLLGGNFNDTLTGNAGANTLRGGAGADALNGGGSSDIFDYNALTDAGDIITGFVAGAGGDKLDIDTLLSALGYAGVDPFADGYVRVLQSGLDSLLQIDSNGATAGANFATTLATLLNVTATNVTLADNFVV